MIRHTGSEIHMIGEEVTWELIVGLIYADWKMITADGNQCDITKVAESMAVNIYYIIPVSILSAKSASVQVTLNRALESSTWKYEPSFAEGNY